MINNYRTVLKLLVVFNIWHSVNFAFNKQMITALWYIYVIYLNYVKWDPIGEQSNFFTLSSVCLCEKATSWLCSQSFPPSEDSTITVILLCFNTKMETLVQLKNNPFLMGLCRNCPPPDLQYDNSSGKRRVFLVGFSFVFFPPHFVL